MSQPVTDAMKAVQKTIQASLDTVAEGARTEGRGTGYRIAVCDVLKKIKETRESPPTRPSTETEWWQTKLDDLSTDVAALKAPVYANEHEKPVATPDAAESAVALSDVPAGAVDMDAVNAMIDGKEVFTLFGYQAGALTTENVDFDAIRERLTNPMIRFLHALLGKASELGELVEPFKKHLFYGKEMPWLNIVEEMGDDSWYSAIRASVVEGEAGVPWDEVLRRNLAKLRTRFPDGFTEPSALNRDLDAEEAALEGDETREGPSA